MEQDEEPKTLQDDWKQFGQFLAFIESLPEQDQKTAYRKMLSRPEAELVINYLKIVEKVKKDKGLSDDDKLKQLLTSLDLLHKISLFDEPIPFTSNSINIDLELDRENLHYDEEKYYIDLPPSMVLSPMLQNIFLTQKFHKDLKRRWPDLHITEGKASLEDLHKEWFPGLTQETMKSRDLLDQLLVLHTIKLALNGDEKAIEKLYSLYENSAEGLAITVARKFRLSSEMEDIKQTAKLNLKWLISGYNPEYILKKLLDDRSDEILPKLPKWVRDFYLYYLLEYLPTEIRKNLKGSGMLDTFTQFLSNIPAQKENIRKKRDEVIQTLKVRRTFLGLEWLGMFNLYSPINAGTLWKNTPKRINRFNSYCFRPGRNPNGRIIKMGPKYNLTTWLFGTQGKRQYGKLYQLLRDKYKPMIREKGKTIDFDFRDDFDENHEESLSLRERTKALRAKDAPFQKSPKEIIRELKKYGISQRDAEIYTKWKFRGMFPEEAMTQQELAKRFNLSERWIRKICRRVKTLIKSE